MERREIGGESGKERDRGRVEGREIGESGRERER